MFAPYVAYRLGELKNVKIDSPKKPAGALQFERGNFSTLELIEMEQAPSTDSLLFNEYMARTKAKFNLKGLELDGFERKIEKGNLHEKEIERAQLEARGSKLKRVGPGLWIQISV